MAQWALVASEFAAPFADHMVLQRDQPITVWGKDQPGQRVTVTLSGRSVSDVTDADGRWLVRLPALPVNREGQALTAVGSTTASVDDVLLGDLWLAAGQSNSSQKLGSMINKDSPELAALFDDAPYYRALVVPHDGTAPYPTEPSDDFTGDDPVLWQVVSSANANTLPAFVATTGARLSMELDVPIGLVCGGVGATSIAAWFSPQGLASDPMANVIAPWKEAIAGWDQGAGDIHYAALMKRAKGGRAELKRADFHITKASKYPGNCYNANIHPLRHLPFRGVLWYQGENNRNSNGYRYGSQLAAWIEDWRSNVFADPALQFYIVQLPDLGNKPSKTLGDDAVAEMRLSQQEVSEAVVGVELVVYIDAMSDGNVHPGTKTVVAHRLAQVALGAYYGRPVSFRSPIYADSQVEGDAMRVSFERTGGGLVNGVRAAPAAVGVIANPGPLSGFLIAGADRVFCQAEAVVDGETVVVRSAAVPEPVAVRYAWAAQPGSCSLY
ncbi:MAG: sialate O-acetylesterase, partial [Planctomycetota bacterium]